MSVTVPVVGRHEPVQGQADTPVHTDQLGLGQPLVELGEGRVEQRLQPHGVDLTAGLQGVQGILSECLDHVPDVNLAH